MTAPEQDQRPHRPAFGVVMRGLLMGLAEVVPGVSGGTMAFVTGIYTDLVSSLARFGLASVGMLSSPVKFYQHHNLRFLLLLLVGMAFGVLLFAQLMHYLLAHYLPLVWATFSGVITMSVVVMARSQPMRYVLLWAPVGTLLGISMLWLPQASSEVSFLSVFFAGMIAVCAWLLPAVSGSFVLLTIGLYAPVIEAIARLDLPILVALGGGCVIGILLFAKSLAWLIRHHSAILFSVLTGFMLGSLPRLWPWQDTAMEGFSALLSAQGYQSLTTEPAYVGGVIICAIVGAGGLLGINRLTAP